MRNVSIRRKLRATPGVRNGVNNGLSLVLDAEAYDYADKRRWEKGEGRRGGGHSTQPILVSLEARSRCNRGHNWGCSKVFHITYIWR